MNDVATTGHYANASTTGYYAHASTTGERAHASTTGERAHASTTGYNANASTTGYYAHASTTGYYAHASTTGHNANASTTGHNANASTTGERAHAFAALGAAESAQAVAVGLWVRLSESSLDALVLPEPGYRPMLVSWQDGWPIGEWITMQGGKVVVRNDVLLPDDGRGYVLEFVKGRYVAGCRKFTYDEAIAHWSNPDHQTPDSAARLLAEVERHHAKQVAA
jgi:hypothetical protein